MLGYQFHWLGLRLKWRCGFYSRRWQRTTHQHHWILKVSSFIVRIQMPNFTANKRIKMKSLKVGSRHISKRSLLLRQLFLSDCSSQFINFKAYCLPFLLQVSLLFSEFSPQVLGMLTQTQAPELYPFISSYSFTIPTQWSKTMFSSGITKLGFFCFFAFHA